MNLPNKLTISRLVLTAGFLGVMFSRVPFRETIALVLFIAGGVSDLLDGMMARRHKLITNFGILMDPLADKILVCSAALALVSLALWHGLRSFADRGLGALIVVVVAVFGCGGLVYLGAAKLLRVEELSVVNLLLRRGRALPTPPEETEAVP